MEFIGKGPIRLPRGRILVRVPNWIGDAVIGTAALRAIRESFPRARISALAKPWVIPVLLRNPDIDEIIRYDGTRTHRGISGLLRLAGYLRERRFDAAILMQRAFEAALIAFLARIPIRLGYATDGRGWLLTHRARAYRKEFDVPRLEHDLMLLEGFGIRAGRKAPLLAVGREAWTGALERLEALGVGLESTLAGLAPGAVGSPYKRWFPERFAELAVRIREAFGATVLLFGSDADEALGEEIQGCASDPAVLNLAGTLDLEEAMALVSACGLFVTNDSGLMHVAAALDVPLVALFGPTDPRRTAPWSENHILVRKELDCSRGCRMKRCDHGHRCMEAITVDLAFEAVSRLVERFGMSTAEERLERTRVTDRAVPVTVPGVG